MKHQRGNLELIMIYLIFQMIKEENMSKAEELAKELNKANGLLTGLVLKKLDTLIDYNITLQRLDDII